MTQGAGLRHDPPMMNGFFLVGVLASAVAPADRCPNLPDCLRACAHGHAGACRQVGDHYARGLGVPRDQAEAASRWKSACDAGDAKGCARLGRAQLHGVGVPVDRAGARALLHKACQGGWGGGCRDLAWAVRTGTGGKVDAKQAAAHDAEARRRFQKGCATDPEACRGLADALVREDPKKAALFAGRACETGDPEGCTTLAGLDNDVKQSLRTLEGACESGALRACRSLGARLAAGVGTKPDPARAERLLKVACDGGDPLGCSSLGQMYLKAGQGERAARVLDGGCAHGESEACYVRGVMLAKADDVTASLHKMGRACVLGHGPACVVVGEGHRRGAKGVAPDPAAARASYLRGCALGEKRACERVSE